MFQQAKEHRLIGTGPVAPKVVSPSHNKESKSFRPLCPSFRTLFANAASVKSLALSRTSLTLPTASFFHSHLVGGFAARMSNGFFCQAVKVLEPQQSMLCVPSSTIWIFVILFLIYIQKQHFFCFTAWVYVCIIECVQICNNKHVLTLLVNISGKLENTYIEHFCKCCDKCIFFGFCAYSML